MRILVTGATGFIGSTLVPELRARGHEVWEMVRWISRNQNNPLGEEQRVFADLRDSREVHEAILKAKPEIIVHLAAQSAVSYSFLHPEEVNEVVYMGTVRVANAALEAGAYLLFASSSEVYGRGEHHHPLTESEPLGGTSPYASAKIGGEEYIRTLNAIHGLPFTIMRPFNTIGRSTVGARHFVVERAICQAIETGRIELHDARPRRDFMFRTDHVGAYVAVIKALEALEPINPMRNETFNVCTGETITIEEMARKVAASVQELKNQPEAIPVSFAATPDRPLDIPILQGSHAHITERLGWTPLLTIAEGIERAAEEWYRLLKLPF